MTATPSLPVRRRFWPRSLAGKAFVGFVAAIVLLIALWSIALAATQRRLDKAMVVARTLGYSENWDDYVGPPIPDEENASISLGQAGAIANQAMIKGNATRLTNNPAAQAEYTKAVLDLPNDAKYESLLNEADRRPRYRSRLTFPDSMLSTSKRFAEDTCYMLSIAEAEQMIAADFVEHGRRNFVLSRLLRHLRLTRKWTVNEPWFVVQNYGTMLRGIAFKPMNDILRRGGLSPSVHDDIEAELPKHDAIAKESVRALNAARIIVEPWKIERLPSYRYSILKPLKLIDQIHREEAYNTFINSLGERYSDAALRLNVPHPLHGVGPRWLGATGDYGTMLAVRKNFDETTARVRCLRIINAMAKSKNFNAALDSLGLPPECLIDPMNGEPLRVKQTPDGPIVYSVGSDLNDDGGKIEAFQPPYDVGFGPPPKAAKK